MTNLLDPTGRPIPTQEETAALQDIATTMNTIMGILTAQKADINMLASIGVNLIVTAYTQIPGSAEKEFINHTMQILARSFGAASVKKQEIEREARKATNEALAMHGGKLN